MALEFQRPPDWLIQDYMNRKSPVVEGLDATAKIAQIYMQEKARREGLQLRQQEGQRQQEELGMKQREQFYNYGDVSSLPPEQASQIGQPVQGPVTEEGMAPQGSPLIARFNEFLTKYPQGLEGAKASRPLQTLSLNQMPVQVMSEAEALKRGEVPKGTQIVKPSEEEKLTARNRAKLDAERPKATASLNNTLREYDNMLNEAKAIRNDPALGAATGLTSLSAAIPGTPMKRVGARLETLKAKTLLNVLASLKELSSTGASGFGQLSNIEGDNLRNSITTLDRSMQSGDFKASLDRFIQEMDKRKDVLRSTYEQTYGGSFVRPSQPPAVPQGGGLTPEQRRARIAELKQRQGVR